MKIIKDISKINFHDAKVEKIIIENDDVFFVIPNGLSNDPEESNVGSCKLKFKLASENDGKISYSKFLYPAFIRRLNKNSVIYKTKEFSSLKELAKITAKEKGFEIIGWYFTTNYVNLDCVFNFFEPLRIELDILDSELIVD